MFAQLWHTGRSAHVETTGGVTPVSASVDPSYWHDGAHLVSTPNGWQQPSSHRSLEASEIVAIVEDYRRAAERAKAAGFDGVELHSANGYLIDQFLQNGSNHRSDSYGGSIENRTRLLLEVVEALASVWGSDRVGVRIGPSGQWNGMSDSDPQALFAYVADALNRFGLAYLHIVEPRVKGNVLVAEGQAPVAAEQLRRIFKSTIIAAGGFKPESAGEIVAKADADLVAFGRHFISNPDLPRRIELGQPLSRYDRDTFYTFDAHGYTDYTAHQAETAFSRAALYALALGTFAVGTEGFMIAAILPNVAGSFSVSVPAAGQLVTIFALVYALSSPILTAVIPRRRLLMLALVGFMASNLLAAVAPSYWFLAAARVLLALTAGLYVPNANALAGAMAPPAYRGRALAIVNAGITIAVAVGVPLGAVVGANFGWRFTFVGVAALCAVALTVLSVLLPRGIAGSPPSSLVARLAVISRPGALTALLTTTLWASGTYAVYTYVSPFLAASASVGSERA